MRLIGPNKWLFIIIALTAVCPKVSFAAPPKDSKLNDRAKRPFKFLFLPSQSVEYGYIYPNENFVTKALPILAKAPNGIFISVGTDRGFNNASMTESTDGLLLLDVDASAVWFNQVNIALLKASRSREHYLHLRLHASFQEWAEVSTDDDVRLLLGEYKNWEKWRKSVREDSRFENFHKLPRGSEDSFYEANYLYYDRQFERIQKLAIEGHIVAELFDFNNQKAVANLVAQLYAKKLKVSVIDLSNAWTLNYIKEENMVFLLEQFKSVTKSSSVLKISPTLSRTEFGYLGFTFSRLKQEPNPEAVLRLLYKFMIVPKDFSGTMIGTNWSKCKVELWELSEKAKARARLSN